MYDDIYTQLLSSADGGLGLTAADLMNIMNGTSAQTEDVQSTVKNLLGEKLADTSKSESYLKFSLNPNANPTYTVNNYDYDLNSGDTSGIKQLSGGGSISVTFNSGLNNTNIQPCGDSSKKTPSIKVWIKKISAASELPDSNSAIDYLLDLQKSVKKLENPEDEENQTEFVEGETKAGDDSDSEKWLLIYDYSQHNDAADSSATGTFGAEIPSGKIESGAYYLFGVTGCDMDKMDFAQKTTFVFQGTVNGFAPTVKITSPEMDNTYSNEAGINFIGSAAIDSSDGLYVELITADFKYGVSGENSSGGTKIEYLVEKNADGNFTVKKITGKTESGYETEEISGSGPLVYYPEDVYEIIDENSVQTQKKVHAAGDFIFDVSKIDGYSNLSDALRAGKEYSYSLDISATSSSGHSSSAVRSVYVDTVAPSFLDEKSFVGGKSSKDAVCAAWFGSESLKVKGVLEENGSGVSQVEYWLDKENSNSEEDGIFVPSKDNDGNYVFSGAISGFSEILGSDGANGAHSLEFVAVDKAGNKSAAQTYSIKVDLTSPSVESKFYKMNEILGAASGNILTNKENDIEIYGLVSDTASGLESIEIQNATVTYTTKSVSASAENDSENENAGSAESEVDLAWFTDESAKFEEYDEENAAKYTGWKAVILKDKIAAGDVSYTAKDIAGNTSSGRIFTFTVDTTPPAVEYAELSDADADTDGTQVNGIITISGTASDNNQMKKITGIEYRIGENGDWTEIADGLEESTSAYKWQSKQIDTAELFQNSKTSPQTVFFRARALDMAGNYSLDADSGIKLVIDQSSDRPVIRVTSLSEKDAVISSTSIMGTISDDDGIESFEYAFASKITEKTEWNEIAVSSGSWKIDGLEAGTHSLVFRVTDKAGTAFETGKEDGKFAENGMPYFLFESDTEKSDNDSALTFSVDLNPPEIKSFKLAATSSATAPAENSAEWSENSVNLGKTNKYLWIYIKADEDVKVHDSAKDDISVKIGQTSIDFDSENFKNLIVSRTPEGSVNGELTYIIGSVDISAISGAEGTQTVSVTVKDSSGRENSAAKNIYVDEGAPELSITSPNAQSADSESGKTNGVSVTTEAITGKYTIKGRVADTSGISKFKYMIPTQTQIKSGINSSLEGWKSVKNLAGSKIDEMGPKLTSSQWQIDFTSSSFENDFDKNSAHGNSLIYYASAKSDGNLIYASEESDENDGKVYVPLYFYVEDATGNGEIVESKILVNPKGGIPEIEIISPENLAKTGGNLNFQGTASDDEEIEKVVLEELYFSQTEAADKKSAENITDWKKVPAEILKLDGVVTKAHKDSSGAIDGINEDGTITADGTSSWKISINTSKIPDTEFKKLLGENELKTVRAVIIAYDKNGTPSNYDISTFAQKEISSDSDENETSYVRRTIFVDKNAPKLVTKQLVQFEKGTPASADEKPSVIRNYSAGMYISGNSGNKKWYLKGVVEDDASVKGISVTTSGKNYIPLEGAVENGSVTGEIIYSGLDSKSFTFLIPLKTSDEGQFYCTVEMDDGQHSDVTENLSFFVDNGAPSLYTTAGKASSALDSADSLRLVSNGENVSESNAVENSDGAYTFGDSVLEEKSGLDFIAVYFKKSANEKFGTKNRVYSPLFAKDAANDNAAEILDKKTADSVYENSEGLPALVKTVTRSAADKISYSGLGKNEFIKPYTVVKIAGSYIRITGIEGDVATLASEVDTTVTECEFIYAQIVDHAVSEGLPSQKNGEISNDDGDGFVETLKQAGSSYKWSASVYSDNIPDGPAEIHVAAFDNAGNFNSGYVKTSIQNNRPRIAKVMLATDLDGNGKFDFYNQNSSIINDLSDDDTAQNGTQFGEYVFYSTLKASDTNASGAAQSKITLSAPKIFNIKKDLLVLPEFVGGNGILKYAYKIGDSALSAPVTGSEEDENGGLKKLLSTAEALKLSDKANSAQESSALIQDTKDGENLKYGGAILEMNEKTHAAYDDEKTYYLSFTFWDATSETTQGTDSLWALLNIPAVIDVKDTTAPLSKIKPFYWNSKDDSSFVYDDEGQALGHISFESKSGEKPGVSGQIYIDGISFDETRLYEIHIIKPDETETDVKIIWKEDNEWKLSDGAEIVSEEEPSQDGHKITWRFKVDMTSYGVATDKILKTYALDAQNNKEDSSSDESTEKSNYSGKADDGSKWKPAYKMDFVPYIKTIYTTEIGSASRSRLGKFPVRAGQKMTIEGMNFAEKSSYKVNFYKTKDETAESDSSKKDLSGTISENGKIEVTAPEYSRYVEVEIDGVKTPNNNETDISKIPGCDIEEGYIADSYKVGDANYNAKGFAAANKDGTNFWTNNRYIAVWSVGTSFSGSINPHSGVVKKIRKEDTIEKNGAVGLKKTGSEITPEKDMTDNYMGFISSDDMRTYIYKNTEKNVAMSPTSDVSLFTAPVDAVDMVVLGGLPYYVIQTNYVGNVNANCWGPGLMIAREGFAYEKGTYESTTGLQEDSLKWIIERQGSNSSAMQRDSSTGYDSVLYQFKNPRIAGWHTDNPGEDATEYKSNEKRKQLDYLYVSYYDSYAKCLKFAAFRSGRDVDANSKISTLNTTANNQWGGGNAGDKELVAEARSAGGNMKNGACVVAGYDTITNNPTSFNEKAGEWSDIAVDSTSESPVPVIVYYNETKKCLEVARGKSKFPKSENYGKEKVETLSGADAWTKSTGIRPLGSKADFGRYVSMAIDSSGNLHVAAQDAAHSTLHYLYLKKNGEEYSVEKSFLLDSSSGSGLWTDIELLNPSGSSLSEIQPAVSYINSSYVGTTSGIKTAYVSYGEKDDIEFDSMTDPAEWSAGNQRTSVMADVYESGADSIKSKLAVGFNSDMLAIDFLRGEE